MIQHLARIFARKFPPTKESPLGKTLILMVATGDVKELTDEAMHNCRVIDMDSLTITVTDREPQPHLLGWEAGDILEIMGKPLRTSNETP